MLESFAFSKRFSQLGESNIACLRNTVQDREARILEGQLQRESSSSASDDQWFWISDDLKFMSLVSHIFFQVLNSYIKLLKLRDS